ncbi:sulfur carrier protein ThiS [Rouxiella chamberiensis]|uniref:Sulfur carrier protein ThiS n=1 Tax=Rouxiella chamberiensis TaxID=1513468 RepID=A0ABY7HLY6_9GAMM|nr:sulfur carrier protein ThiS [Rouxiella chamberiensis]WAT00394.1 sulfur carrier protein ThiS [Rouxiella chamberiensis]
MNITVNDSDYQFEAPITLDGLLAFLEHSQSGSALAVNQVIVPRPQWAEHRLEDGDNVVIFQAIAGG